MLKCWLLTRGLLSYYTARLGDKQQFTNRCYASRVSVITELYLVEVITIKIRLIPNLPTKPCLHFLI